MPWWKRSVTVMFVPHSDTRNLSLSLPWWLAGVGAFLAVVTFMMVLASVLVGWSGTLIHDGELFTQQDLEELKQERDHYRQQATLLTNLEEEIQRNRTKQQTLLRLTGFDRVELTEESTRAPNLTEGEGIKLLQKHYDELIDRNRELARVQEFAEDRNKMLQHTPTLWPAEGWVSSTFGHRHDPMGGSGSTFHRGIDIAAWPGSPVRAPADGEVVKSGWNGGYGLTVKLEHEYGYSTLFAHLSENLVDVGDQVTKGTMIGRVGQTGRSTGPHLHYEILVNDEPINPEPYLIEQYEAHEQYR